MQQVKFLMLIFMPLLVSCENENQQKEYFPVDAWLSSELIQIDSLPVAITKYRTEGSKTDTTLSNKKEFRELANGLLNIHLNESHVKKQYEEMVLDEGNNTNISIIYTTADGYDLPLKKIQVNVKPGQSAPKSIYAERIDQVNDIKIIRKIIWTSGKSMLVNSVYYQGNKINNTISEKFEWGI
jgi:hypothetical protein